MKIKYQYTTIYNYRPNETFGMGKESLIIKGEGDVAGFLENIARNSSIKFEDNIERIYGTDEAFENPEWNDWIGRPMFLITDIKVEFL